MDSHTNSQIIKLANRAKKITADSRLIKPGDVFVAIKGQSLDGNKFIDQAIQAGAIGVIADNYTGDNDRNSAQVVVVENTLHAIWAAAKEYRQSFDISVIAVAGSNGKTTTKDMIRDVLATKHKVHANKESYNSVIGIPITILEMPADTEIAVFELGSSKIGEIEKLCNLAQPTAGLITNFGKDHLGKYGSEENVVTATLELVHYIQKQGGEFFINRNLPQLEDIETRQLYGFGVLNDSIKLTNKDVCVSIVSDQYPLEIDYNQITIKVPVFGVYNAYNCAAALAVAKRFGVDAVSAADALRGFKPSAYRSLLYKATENNLNNVVIVDTYNANPSNVASALQSLQAIKSPQDKVVILGDMKELGDYSAQEHRSIFESLPDYGVDFAIFVGPEYKQVVQEDSIWFADSDQTAAYLRNNPIKESLVLLKGSNSLQMHKTLHALGVVL